MYKIPEVRANIFFTNEETDTPQKSTLKDITIKAALEELGPSTVNFQVTKKDELTNESILSPFQWYNVT